MGGWVSRWQGGREAGWPARGWTKQSGQVADAGPRLFPGSRSTASCRSPRPSSCWHLPHRCSHDHVVAPCPPLTWTGLQPAEPSRATRSSVPRGSPTRVAFLRCELPACPQAAPDAVRFRAVGTSTAPRPAPGPAARPPAVPPRASARPGSAGWACRRQVECEVRAGLGRGAGTAAHTGPRAPRAAAAGPSGVGRRARCLSWPREGPERAWEQVRLGEPCCLLPPPWGVGQMVSSSRTPVHTPG